MYKVLLGMCTGGEIKAQTVTSLLSLMAYGPQVLLSTQIGGYKTFNLNRLIKQARDNDCTHFLSVDSDMIFPADGLARLLKHDKDVVGANYSYRGAVQNQANPPSVVKFEENGQYVERDVPDGLFECSALGLGFLLFRLEVFDKLAEPLFELDETRPAMEDVIICEKLRRAGVKIYCDADIKLGHIGTYIY